MGVFRLYLWRVGLVAKHLPVLRGSRVIMRDLVRSDVDAMAEWPQFEEPALQWANLDFASRRNRDAYFEKGKSSATSKRFAVFSHEGRHVGTIGLRNINSRIGDATLGIIIRSDEVGRGYGADAIRCLLRFAFESLQLRRVKLDVAEANLRAQRCYLSVGFREIGQHVGFGGTIYIDMAITRDDYVRQVDQDWTIEQPPLDMVVAPEAKH